MSKKLPFTPNSIDALRAGKIGDPRTPGLSIEATPKGPVWLYVRRIKGAPINAAPVRLRLGTFPAFTIADARQWADDLNAKVARGEDPREAMRTAKVIAALTVKAAHNAYIADLEKGERKTYKPRTLKDKRYIYDADIDPGIGSKPLASITANDLWDIVEAKGETAPVRANRMAAEVKVFFGWCIGRTAQKAGIALAVDPSASLNGKHYAETPGSTRYLKDDEIGFLFAALARLKGSAARSYRRGLLLMLLTGARIGEVINAVSASYSGGTWTIPGGTGLGSAKNHQEHAISLSPWGQSLAATNTEWLIPQAQADKPINNERWYRVVIRVHSLMEEIAGRSLEPWSPHDLRRTLRSNGRKLGIDYETREAMLNHSKVGLDRRYDVEDMSDAMRDGFACWEAKLTGIAQKVGVADALDCPAI